MNEVSHSTRDKVWALETENLKRPQIIITPVHRFSDGVCAREITIPKGTVVTGGLHKYETINIMSKGDLSVLTEDGMIRVQAPYTVVSPAGTKRAAYAHEDTVWTTILVTDKTDIAEIEDHFVSKTEADYLSFQQKLIENL